MPKIGLLEEAFRGSKAHAERLDSMNTVGRQMRERQNWADTMEIGLLSDDLNWVKSENPWNSKDYRHADPKRRPGKEERLERETHSQLSA